MLNGLDVFKAELDRFYRLVKYGGEYYGDVSFACVLNDIEISNTFPCYGLVQEELNYLHNYNRELLKRYEEE